MSKIRAQQVVAEGRAAAQPAGRRSVQLPRILMRIYIAVAVMLGVIAASTVAFSTPRRAFRGPMRST